MPREKTLFLSLNKKIKNSFEKKKFSKLQERKICDITYYITLLMIPASLGSVNLLPQERGAIKYI
jgi:hypothetical protein